MAAKDINLGGGNSVTISGDNAEDGDVLNISDIGGASELTVDGLSYISIGSVGSIESGASPTFNAVNGGSLKVDSSLKLNSREIDSSSFGVGDGSEVTLNISHSAMAGNYNVDFSGNGGGSFTLNAQNVDPYFEHTFNITGMQAGDKFTYDGGQLYNSSSPEPAYRDGALHLTNKDVENLSFRFEMTEEQANEVMNDPTAFFSDDQIDVGSFANEVGLVGGQEVTVAEGGVTNGDIINILGISGDSKLTIDGLSGISIGSMGRVEDGSAATFNVINGGDLTVDQFFLSTRSLKDVTFGVGDGSEVTLNLASSQGLINYNIDFSSNGTGAFTLNKGHTELYGEHSFSVSGMQAGDQFDLGGGNWSLDEGPAGDQEAYRDGALHLTESGTETGLNVKIEMTEEEYAEFQKDPDAFLSGGSYTQVCFAAGTMISTPDGEAAVETLSIGDLVMTASGEQVPVKWIGRQTIRRLAAAGNYSPVRIREGALAAGIPNQDLVLTASHGVILDDLVINAGALVNHDTIDYVPGSELPDAVTYYHIETDSHEVILANGTEAETYVDYVDRQAFDNYAEYVALYGIETRVVEMPRHRISSRRLLPLALRERLGIEDVMSVAKTA